MTMNVSAVLIALLVGSIRVHTSNASSKCISSSSFAVGYRAKVICTAPPTGRVSVNLYDKDDVEIPLQVDYRVGWNKDKNTILLNTRTRTKWGKEVRIRGITTAPGTLVAIVIVAQKDSFTISLNGKQVATYQYRINKPVIKIEYQNYTYI